MVHNLAAIGDILMEQMSGEVAVKLVSHAVKEAVDQHCSDRQPLYLWIADNCIDCLGETNAVDESCEELLDEKVSHLKIIIIN